MLSYKLVVGTSWKVSRRVESRFWQLCWVNMRYELSYRIVQEVV